MESSPITVLVADDNPGIVELITLLLRDAGLNVETASDGEEAVEKARALHPNLILLDIMMPAVDGWEAAARLLADRETRDIPIIFLTARARTEEQLKGWELPIFEYITKPFDMDELVSRVMCVLNAPREERGELRDELRREKLRRLLGLEAKPE